MKLPPELEDQINRIESLEARRTRLLLALEGCNHKEHQANFLIEIAETCYAIAELSLNTIPAFRDLGCDTVEWPDEIPASKRP